MCAFEVGAYDQGAHVTYLGPSGSQIGYKESIRDTARVLGRMYDGIEYRGSAHANVEILGDLCGRTGMERPHRRLAPDPDAGRHPHDARPLRRLHWNRSPTATSATPATTRRTPSS